MKKLFAMLLAVAMVFSLAACGSNPSGENSQPPVNGGNEESAEPSQAPSEAPSEALPAPGSNPADDIPDTMTSADSKYQDRKSVV